MGGGTSAQSNPFTQHIVMPPYYIEDAFLSEDEMAHIRESWQLIMDDKAAGYLKSKEEGDLSEEHSGVVFFYESFYKRLFDVHPSSRVLFQSSLDKMGVMLVGMLSSAVSLLNNISELAPRLEGLAKMHAKKGVVAFQYGVVGEVLFWGLSKSLGPEYFQTVNVAWTKVYSIMLKIMVPIAIEEEAVKYQPVDE